MQQSEMSDLIDGFKTEVILQTVVSTRRAFTSLAETSSCGDNAIITEPYKRGWLYQDVDDQGVILSFERKSELLSEYLVGGDSRLLYDLFASLKSSTFTALQSDSVSFAGNSFELKFVPGIDDITASSEYGAPNIETALVDELLASTQGNFSSHNDLSPDWDSALIKVVDCPGDFEGCDNGAFIIDFNFAALDRKMLSDFPKLSVENSEGTSSSTILLLPDQPLRVFVPIRFFKSFYNAEKVYRRLGDASAELFGEGTLKSSSQGSLVLDPDQDWIRAGTCNDSCARDADLSAPAGSGTTPGSECTVGTVVSNSNNWLFSKPTPGSGVLPIASFDYDPKNPADGLNGALRAAVASAVDDSLADMPIDDDFVLLFEPSTVSDGYAFDEHSLVGFPAQAFGTPLQGFDNFVGAWRSISDNSLSVPEWKTKKVCVEDAPNSGGLATSYCLEPATIGEDYLRCSRPTRVDFCVGFEDQAFVSNTGSSRYFYKIELIPEDPSGIVGRRLADYEPGIYEQLDAKLTIDGACEPVASHDSSVASPENGSCWGAPLTIGSVQYPSTVCVNNKYSAGGNACEPGYT
ncbi:MAG: hypothetical protein GOV15_04855, partial [Candidatus Diapherotrites archaeon]|nr:hypothetical protein [Candidatus Diapherotrites archaeon]